MRNLEIWIITLITAIVFVVGVAYYKILDAVVNAVAFILSLTMIFLALILLIIFSQPEQKRKIEKPQVKNEKPKIEEQKTSSKKLRVDREK